jgi:hypothetical protein
MNLKPLVFALALPLCASGRNSPVVAMLSNLNTPGPQGGGIGDLETLLPGTGFGVGFVTGGSSLTLSSVALELYGYSPPGFHVQIYTFGPPGGVSPPGWPLVLYGELGQAAVDPRPTLWPGTTTFLDFTSSATITLTPHSAFVIAATEDAGGTDNNALRFGYSESYAVAPDWQVYPAQNVNQWYLDPNFGEWLPSAPSGFLGMVLEVNAALVPEPSALTFLLAASIMLVAPRVTARSRPVPPLPPASLAS